MDYFSTWNSEKTRLLTGPRDEEPAETSLLGPDF
jgi:hypothetical protein